MSLHRVIRWSSLVAFSICGLLWMAHQNAQASHARNANLLVLIDSSGNAIIQTDTLWRKTIKCSGPADGLVNSRGFWFPLNSFEWGSPFQGNAPSTGGAVKGNVHDIHITKTADTADSMLFHAPATGKSLGTCELKVDNLQYTLTNTMVSRYSVSSVGKHPTESITLNFTKIDEQTPLTKSSPNPPASTPSPKPKPTATAVGTGAQGGPTTGPTTRPPSPAPSTSNGTVVAKLAYALGKTGPRIPCRTFRIVAWFVGGPKDKTQWFPPALMEEILNQTDPTRDSCTFHFPAPSGSRFTIGVQPEVVKGVPLVESFRAEVDPYSRCATNPIGVPTRLLTFGTPRPSTTGTPTTSPTTPRPSTTITPRPRTTEAQKTTKLRLFDLRVGMSTPVGPLRPGETTHVTLIVDCLPQPT